MGESTHISWADATFNPWVGCAKVSPACDGCYAEHMMATRMGRVTWGAPGQGAGTRERTSPANWRKPLAWDRQAAKTGTRPFVFCASLADVFDNAVPQEWRADLFDLIRATPHLTWLLLTKRPGNIGHLFRQTWPNVIAVGGSDATDPALLDWPRNAAIGCTVVTQEEADRDIPKLLAAKGVLKPAFAFVSMEPLLGAVDIAWALNPLEQAGRLDWVITGGETDQGQHKARPSHPDWFRSLRDQCAAAGVAYHHKQNGEWAPGECARRAAVRSEDVAWWFNDAWDFGRLTPTESMEMHADDEPAVFRLGKDRSGRTLDGAVHDARPQLGPA